ncbi:MAG: polysaccharide pyruvyl transferase family protein [Bacteroidales bacterium]|nr:polysaccharide pyruvyl transferase family protein [Bacteroidales bacterium]
MNIAIITLPLHTNYGGLLQAYALKHKLEQQGHKVDVIDLKDKMPAPKGLKAPFIYLRRMASAIFKGTEVFREKRYARELPVVAANTSKFVDKYISPRMVNEYKDIKEGEYDAFVVGSDQVWRPLYFRNIEDAFLRFAEGWDVKRIAYAASFGTDRLEYEYMQLEACGKLLEQFDAVSVREDSAVRMCEEWLDYEGAVHVADPVMLLDASELAELVKRAGESEGHPAAGRILTYILDPSKEKSAAVDFISRVSSAQVYDASVNPYARELPLNERVVPSVEKWIAGFAEADFVVTDSFHGCVLSILMHKKFLAVGNSRRGMARLSSLLDMFGLDGRLVHGIDPEDDGEYFLSDIGWEAVDEKLKAFKEHSEKFLADALAKR